MYLLSLEVNLQYCIGFAIHQHESTTDIHVFLILNTTPSSLPIPSLWVIKYTRPKHPVSCIKSGLAIHFIYDIIHFSMPFSQIIPPFPSPTESKRLYTSVSLLLSCIQGYRYHLSKIPCPVLTVASWLAYRFFRRQVRWSGSPISLRIFYSLLWST